MNIRVMSHALLLTSAMLAASATPGAAFPGARPALTDALAGINVQTEAAARRATRSRNVNVNKRRDVNVNRNVNVNVKRRVVVRPVRPWVHRPWFGTVVAGVALGTIIAATTIPPAPAPNLCWFWSDASNTHGYWDYCTPPR
jgi:hypothetical protein